MSNNQFFWQHQGRYNDFPSYFRNKFTDRVQKISIDAGFTCPNRDGSKSSGGCTYCNNTAFKPDYCNLKKSIAQQVTEGIDFFGKKYKSMRFIAYFQAFTNTYAPIDKLKLLYSEALENPKVIGLVISTRPDCLSSEVLDYLQALSEEVYVMIEIGVESCHNSTLERINRGHSVEDSIRAIESIASRGIHNCAHLIAGLPGETRAQMLQQASFLSALPVENIKLHQLQINTGTTLAEQYSNSPNEFALFETYNDYIEFVIAYLELLRPSIIVERFVSQSPKGMVIAPGWGIKNFEFVDKLQKRMVELDTWQGRLYNP